MWYYAFNRQQCGPVSEEQIPLLISTGEITPQTLVWRQGMAGWQNVMTTELANLLQSSSPSTSDSQKYRHRRRNRKTRMFGTIFQILRRNRRICRILFPVLRIRSRLPLRVERPGKVRRGSWTSCSDCGWEYKSVPGWLCCEWPIWWKRVTKKGCWRPSWCGFCCSSGRRWRE